MERVKKEYDDFWYKLYADDMVLILKNQHIKKFLKILINQFKEFNLLFNAKKSAIMNIRNHKSIIAP